MHATKSTRTREKMNQALRELLYEKPIESITVTDITKRVGVNRQTFYYHYSSIDEMLESAIKEELERHASENISPDSSIHDIYLATLDLIEENRTILRSMLTARGRITLLPLLKRCAFEILHHRIQVAEATRAPISLEEREWTLEYCLSASALILEEWVLGEFEMSKDDLAARLTHSTEQQLVGLGLVR